MTKPAPVSNSYMELCIHVDGGQNLYLRVPTVWDDRKKLWIGFIKTPKTQRLIHGEGKDSFSLQNSFNAAICKILEESSDPDEVFSMFQPLSYWDEMSVTQEGKVEFQKEESDSD